MMLKSINKKSISHSLIFLYTLLVGCCFTTRYQHELLLKMDDIIIRVAQCGDCWEPDDLMICYCSTKKMVTKNQYLAIIYVFLSYCLIFAYIPISTIAFYRLLFSTFV
ncbi:hypothetical protein HanRHA438_Chr08g0345821 [Helianthus annuus]|nr:hypothetical protein HanRHA438_Chr08g0345821 [Helianthus annuus]